MDSAFLEGDVLGRDIDKPGLVRRGRRRGGRPERGDRGTGRVVRGSSCQLARNMARGGRERRSVGDRKSTFVLHVAVSFAFRHQSGRQLSGLLNNIKFVLYLYIDTCACIYICIDFECRLK